MYEDYCRQCRALGMTLEEAIDGAKYVFGFALPWYVIAVWWKLT